MTVYKNLKYKKIWILIGYSMVAFVIYSSLTSSPVSMDFKMSDKVMHMVGYFGLMGWFVQVYDSSKYYFKLAIVFIMMGVGLEFLQDLGGVRHFELWDMVANTCGVLVAWALVKTPFPYLLEWFEKKILKAI